MNAVEDSIGRNTLVIAPALNEDRTIGPLVEETRRLGYDICVIDDGSTDRTAACATTAGAAVLQMPLNLGVGGALRCGFRWALAHGYDTVVQVDADGQHDPNQIEVLLKVLRESEADMVIGSRFAGGTSEYKVRSARRMAMGFLARRASKISGATITDSTSGFRAICRPLLDNFASDYPVEYLGDTVEALIYAGRAGAEIIECPVTMAPREHGMSSAGLLASLWYVTRVLIAIELMHRGSERPTLSAPNGRGAG